MTASVSDHSDSRWPFFSPLLILAAGVLAYANSFSCPFIFDDKTVVTANPHIYYLWPPWRAVLVPTRFMADLSFALNYAIGGFNAADYHVANLIIHICAGLLLYGVVRRTLLLPRFEGHFRSASPWLALTVAVLWVAHPLQTESVTYVAQRIEALMGCFYLLAFYCFVRGVHSRRSRWWLDGALAACLLGMGTKEMMVTLPAVMFLYDATFVAPSWLAALRARWKFYVALALSLGFLPCCC